MALQRVHPVLRSCGLCSRGHLLLLYIILGIMLLPRAQSSCRRIDVIKKRPYDFKTAAQSCISLAGIQGVQSQPGKACPPGWEPHSVDEKLVLYEYWKLDACVNAALLEAEMSSVNEVPFTYQQLRIFKCKLDQRYPQGYPESLISSLGYFFLEMTPKDIHKWNVTSLKTVKSLLKVSKGRNMQPQVAALIQRYMLGRRQLDLETVNTLEAYIAPYVCSLSPELLGHVQESVIWEAKAQYLKNCSLQQLNILYRKANLTFQHLQGTDYFIRIQPYLGGASTEDLRDLIRRKITLDMAAMKQLQPAAVKPLTVPEVQKLLGPNLPGLKAAMTCSPVWEWILSKPQSDLDQLGLGLQGGIPNGYLDLYFPMGRMWDVKGGF